MSARSHGAAAEPYLGRLREGKVKVTPNRRRVLERFLEGEGTWTLGSLHKSLSEEAPCEASSVYRALETLRDAGILEEFRLPGEKPTFYSLIHHAPGRRSNAHGTHGAQGHHHHHVICQDCGRVSHLELCLPSGWMGKVEGASGFRITEHHLEFKGLCGECR